MRYPLRRRALLCRWRLLPRPRLLLHWLSAPPLRPHEIFGFAPYWTLSDSSGFDLSQISTIDYFSIGVNSDGSLDESGPGWTGYQSQDLASLITRAHAAGDRVVLTVSDFDQSSLDTLTSSATAPATLAQALIAAIQAEEPRRSEL